MSSTSHTSPAAAAAVPRLRFGRLVPALMAAAMLLPSGALAQIASPSNAGGNSGNNTSGSSSTSISTPSFTPTTPIPALSGVSVVSASQITATPQQTASMQAATSQAASQQSALLQQIVADGASIPQVVVGPDILLPDISLNAGSTGLFTSFASLPDALAAITPQSALTLTRASIGITATISATAPGGVVTLSLSTGASLQIATTPETTVTVMQFAALASMAGLSLSSIQLGLQVLPLLQLASGSSALAAVQTMQLLAAVQGASAQTNLANLSQAITTFNQIVASAPPEVLVALAGNASFAGIASVLTAAQGGVASAG